MSSDVRRLCVKLFVLVMLVGCLSFFASEQPTLAQSGYCQINGCIDLPPNGYCPSGYYRFWSYACCCPIQ